MSKKIWMILATIAVLSTVTVTVYAVTLNSTKGRLDQRGIMDKDGHVLDITSDGKVVCQ